MRNVKTYSVSMPEDLRNRVKILAEKKCLSFSSTITMILAEYFREEDIWSNAKTYARPVGPEK